jgi:hypothetical protein
VIECALIGEEANENQFDTWVLIESFWYEPLMNPDSDHHNSFDHQPQTQQLNPDDRSLCLLLVLYSHHGQVSVTAQRSLQNISNLRTQILGLGALDL